MTDRPDSLSVTEFLRQALVGGALGVHELEAKAQAAGLLGERQQIRHAKRFKTAKALLNIKSSRIGFGAGAKWAWSLPPQAMPTAAVPASTVAAEIPPQVLLVATANTSEKAPPKLEAPRIPVGWFEGVARLDYRHPPSDVTPLFRRRARWRDPLRGATRRLCARAVAVSSRSTCSRPRIKVV
jgi:hypothetical protein